MSKAILVIDMPEYCAECPCSDDHAETCWAIDKEILEDGGCKKPDWCPMKEMPEKKNYEILSDTNPTKAWGNGWNACIDKILNGEVGND